MNILSKLIKDNSAVAWVWTVILVSLFLYSIVWFSTGWAVIEVADSVESQYTFTGSAAYASEFIKNVFRYHPLLFLFGLGIWGYVNSQRRTTLQ